MFPLCNTAVTNDLIKKKKNSGIVKPSQVLVSGPHIENLAKWVNLGVDATEQNEDVIFLNCLIAPEIDDFFLFFWLKVVHKSDIIFLCVKPHILTTVASELKLDVKRALLVDKDKLFVSVLAGVTLAQLASVSEFDSNPVKI